VVEVADAYTATPCCQFTIEHECIWQGALAIHFFNQEFDPPALKLEDPERSQTRTREF
jgi:propionyl-CoA carboxylase alpha chain